MIDLLKKFNYYPPNIKELEYGKFSITKNDYNYYYLLIDGEQKMSYDIQTHDGAFQVYSHYDLAKGHVVVTGMGFGARENWLLTKTEVTKLTIIEKCKELIDFHKENRSPFTLDKRVEIINQDASDWNGKCDTLLLDHYEFEDYEEILSDVKKIQDQCQCGVMWFWPFERIIMHSRRWHTLNNKDIVDKIGYGHINKMISKMQAYEILKEGWGLNKLPIVNEQTINLYCMMFNSYLFSNSEGLFNSYLSDEKYNELYKYF